MYREQFGKRFLVKCEGFTTRLQANLSDDGSAESLSNVSGELFLDFPHVVHAVYTP